MTVIYQLKNKRSGRTYIGSTRNFSHRIGQWKDWRNCCTNPRLSADLAAEGFDGFEVSVLKEFSKAVGRKALECEEYDYIHALRPFYNTIGKPRPPEVRQKLSVANTGKKQSEETKARRHRSIMARHKVLPQTNAWHKKLYYVEDMNLLCVGSDAVCSVLQCTYASLYKMFKLGRNTIKGHRVSYFSVETNGDECSRVGQRLSSCSKCATADEAEEIVHFGRMVNSRGNDQGVIDLCYRSGDVSLIQAHVVYEKDDYVYELGLDPKLEHRPYRGSDRGSPIAYYAIFKTKNGATGFAWMWREEVLDHAKKFSKSYDSKTGRFYGPWETDFDSMAKKTCLLQALKYAPKKSEFARAIMADSTTKSVIAKDMMSVPNEDFTVSDPFADEKEPQKPQDASEGKGEAVAAPKEDAAQKPSEAAPEVVVVNAPAKPAAKKVKQPVQEEFSMGPDTDVADTGEDMTGIL